MPTTQRTRTARFLLPLAMVTLLGVTACSGGDEGAADDDVATLGSGDDAKDDTTEDDDSGGGGRGGGEIDAEFQDAILEFAECMRDNGIDFPDPQIQDGGGVVIAGPAIAVGGGEGGGQLPSEEDMAEMEAAEEECRPIMEEVEGAMEPPDPEQLQEMQDQALELAQCMREHGIDMPDPEFGEGGRISQSIGSADGPGAIDFSDEDFQEASEECGSEGGFGITVGGGPGGGVSVDGSSAVEGEDD